MFESLVSPMAGSEWSGEEPMPGAVGYESFQVYRAQQDAYWSAVSLGEVPPTGPNSDAGLLDSMRDAAAAAARAEGAKLRAVSDFTLRALAHPEIGYDDEVTMHSVEAHVGLQLGISSSEASGVLGLAMTLTRRLPRTFAALEDGVISLLKARVIAEESVNLDVAQCSRLEASVLPEAQARTPRSLRDKCRREVEKLDADAVRKRAVAARAGRALYVRDEPDGMATLCAYLPADQAYLILDAINARIPAQRGPEDPRAVGARRVDHLFAVLVAALGIDLNATTDSKSPVLTAEQIARLDRGANTYVPSPAMKTAIRARDRHCRFPGCRRPAVHCDIDHTIPFDLSFKAGGRTVYANLGCVCRFHHRVKQFPGWHVSQDSGGAFTWTDPTGRVFITRPPPPDGEEPPEFCPAPAPDEDTPPF